MTMGLKALWQRWFNRPAKARRPRPALRARLAVECLEGREMPASFTAATVPDLIGAITAANLSAEADTITLAPGKTFTLTAQNTLDSDGATGLPVIAAGGGSLTIVGNGDVIERSTAKGISPFRLLTVAPGASLTLQDLTLQGGLHRFGGAIFNEGTLTLQHVTVQNNTAYGGDLSAVPYATGYTASGGGIASHGVLTVTGSTIRNNLAIGGQGGPSGNGGDAYGGGVSVSGGNASFVETIITGNEARGGAKGSGRYKGPPDPFGGKGGPPASPGADGHGFGGGLYIDSWHGALAYLDAYTVAHLTNNRASTSDPNIAGSYAPSS
jgi:hypothetical protein